jgi:hypothetical protein
VADLTVCRIGVLGYPFDLCHERLLVPAVTLGKALAGDMSYPDP